MIPGVSKRLQTGSSNRGGQTMKQNKPGGHSDNSQPAVIAAGLNRFGISWYGIAGKVLAAMPTGDGTVPGTATYAAAAVPDRWQATAIRRPAGK